jgi:peroxiredoxin
MRSPTTLAALCAPILCTLGVAAFAAGPALPRPAKELELIEPSGKHDLLTSYRGKVVIVQFLYTTCPHCQAYSQLLTKLQGEYGPRGLQCLGLAFDDATNSMVTNYVTKYRVGFPVGPAQRDTVLSFLGFSVMDQVFVPQITLIDRKGVIREETEPKPTTQPPLQDEAHLRSSIEKLLDEGSGAKSATPAPTKSTAPTSGSAKKPLSSN